jgi:hypothetical protein
MRPTGFRKREKVSISSGSRSVDRIRPQERRAAKLSGPQEQPATGGESRLLSDRPSTCRLVGRCGPQPEVKSQAHQSTAVIPAPWRCVISTGSPDQAQLVPAIRDPQVEAGYGRQPSRDQKRQSSCRSSHSRLVRAPPARSTKSRRSGTVEGAATRREITDWFAPALPDRPHREVLDHLCLRSASGVWVKTLRQAPVEARVRGISENRPRFARTPLFFRGHPPRLAGFSP